MKQRLLLVDAARGAAIIGVVIFHIIWDLEFVGFISGIAFHPIWLGFGKTLAGSFMFLVGVSQILAHGQAFKLHRFTKRLIVLSLSAFMITTITWFAFPTTFIYFGILHAIAAASLIGLVFLKLPSAIILAVSITILILPYFLSWPTFDTRWLAWVGFSETPPSSNDFVPIFPWVGLSLLGMAITKFRQERSIFPKLSAQYDKNPAVHRLGWFGRYSLIIYLVHQPILLAILIPTARLLT